MSGNINFNGWINDDGSENYKCRAWVNFDGTGTVAILAAGNVSSITDNGTGDYTLNFTTAMVDANYAWTHGHSDGSTSGNIRTINPLSTDIRSTTQFQIRCGDQNNALNDFNAVCIAIFR